MRGTYIRTISPNRPPKAQELHSHMATGARNEETARVYGTAHSPSTYARPAYSATRNKPALQVEG
jgi:hypothetical protein